MNESVSVTVTVYTSAQITIFGIVLEIYYLFWETIVSREFEIHFLPY